MYLRISHAPRERVSWNRSGRGLHYRQWCHAPRERVSWNLIVVEILDFRSESRSTWACELKCEILQSKLRLHRHAPRERVSWNKMLLFLKLYLLGHAPRERVSWNAFYTLWSWCYIGHAPRERVSWNGMCQCDTFALRVTLHVSVWVEIYKFFLLRANHMQVTLHVSVWVEIFLWWV